VIRIVCKEMSPVAVIRDMFSRTTQLIVVVDKAREVDIDLLVICGMACLEYARNPSFTKFG